MIEPPFKQHPFDQEAIVSAYDYFWSNNGENLISRTLQAAWDSMQLRGRVVHIPPIKASGVLPKTGYYWIVNPPLNETL